MKYLRIYRYEIIAALSGLVVMILELIGSRMMAPYFGTSLYVWTAIIGVILGALAFGYWYGGRLADRVARDIVLMAILSGAALLISATLLTEKSVLGLIAALPLDIRAGAILSAVFLFAPASALLGIVSPYIAKLRLSSLKTAGSSIGRLYAAGTFGSIAGTFLAGYWLIGWFGNYTLGAMLVIALAGISFIAERKSYLAWRIIGVVLLVLLLFAVPQRSSDVLADVDSGYSRYQVRQEVNAASQPVRYLLTDNMGAQSGIVVGQPDTLAFQYTRQFSALADAYGPARRTLVIGGGTYTFPAFLARTRPDTQVDAVEIDPALDAIAANYFEYRPRPNLSIIHEDGRVFLNRTSQRYDMAYIDAFSSLTPPYQLATVEAAARLKSILSDDGVAVANVIATPTDSDPYYLATIATYKAVFADVSVYQADSSSRRDQRQNLLVVMGGPVAVARTVPKGARPLASSSARVRLLTDDYAPVEQLIAQSEH